MAVQKQPGANGGCYVLGVYDKTQLCTWQKTEPGSTADLTLIMQDGTSTDCMGQDRSLAVEYTCAQDKSALLPKTWTAVNPTGTCAYVFKVETCAVCKGGCIGAGGAGFGTIFLIILVVTLSVYLIGGSIFYYHSGKRGTEIFISLYPSTFVDYCKAGVAFCFSGCTSGSSGESNTLIGDSSKETSENPYQSSA